MRTSIKLVTLTLITVFVTMTNGYTNSDNYTSLHNELMNHPIYNEISTMDDLRIFMSSHVWAVWDFMVLLKTLQRRVTHFHPDDTAILSAKWKPPTNKIAARMINEIVIGEETDEVTPGNYMSHLELYMMAMTQLNISTDPIKNFLDTNHFSGSPSVHKFVSNTLNAALQSTPYIVSYFLFGREDPIPEMFSRILNNNRELFSKIGSPNFFEIYLKRHIELDANEHAPMARKLIETMMTSPENIKQVENAKVDALRSRIDLWDGILADIKQKRQESRKMDMFTQFTMSIFIFAVYLTVFQIFGKQH